MKDTAAFVLQTLTFICSLRKERGCYEMKS